MCHFPKALYINSKVLQKNHDNLNNLLIFLFEQLFLTLKMNMSHNKSILTERITKIIEEKLNELERIRIGDFLSIFYNYAYLLKFFAKDEKKIIKSIFEDLLVHNDRFKLKLLTNKMSPVFNLTLTKVSFISI